MIIKFGNPKRRFKQRDVLILSHSDLGHGVVRKFRRLQNGGGLIWLWRYLKGQRIGETRAEVELAGIIRDSLTATLQMLEGGTLLHFTLGKDGEERLLSEIAARIPRCSDKNKIKFAKDLLCDIKRTLQFDKLLVLNSWTISCNDHHLSVTRFPIV